MKYVQETRKYWVLTYVHVCGITHAQTYNHIYHGEVHNTSLGMLSKSKGQIIRVAATLHVLFNIETPLAIPTVISDAVIKAAINLVDVCIQHAAFLAGRGDVDETVQEMMKDK